MCVGVCVLLALPILLPAVIVASPMLLLAGAGWFIWSQVQKRSDGQTVASVQAKAATAKDQVSLPATGSVHFAWQA